MLNLELRVRENTLAQENVRRLECRPHLLNRGLFRLCPVAVAILGMFAAASSVTPQEPNANQTPKPDTGRATGIILRQTVRRVRVDVVVTDSQGHPVTGLQASDFRVAEDGKPQSIRQFEYHSDENAEATFTKRPPLPPHTFMNLPTAPERGPLTVLLYDVLNTPVDDQLYAREQMIKFLKKSPGRRIAIFVLGNRLRFLQGFTSDTDSIMRAISVPAAKPQRPTVSYSPTSGADEMGKLRTGNPVTDSILREMTKKEGRIEETEGSERLDLRVDMTLDALKHIGRFLAGIPGRKNLIWYSGSFPEHILPKIPPPTSNHEHILPSDSVRRYNDRIKTATNLLNSAEVAVYPVDARGLPSYTGDFAQLFAESATMEIIAEQTGGRASYNTNALEEALENASAEGSSYYSLVYAPANMKFDRSVRRISVHLEHGHYHLAYRRSYIADDIASIAHKQSAADQSAASPDQAPILDKSMVAASQFGSPLSHQLVFAAHVDAIGAPAPATAEQMAALAPYREQAAKVAHRKFVPPTTPVPMQQYAVAYAVLASQLELLKSASGVYHSDLSMAALAFNADGETLWGTQTRLNDDIPTSKIDNIRKDGFQAIQTFFVPVETAVIRLVVRDERSERIGSMEIRLPLPPDQKQSAQTQ